MTSDTLTRCGSVESKYDPSMSFLSRCRHSPPYSGLGPFNILKHLVEPSADRENNGGVVNEGLPGPGARAEARLVCIVRD